MPVLTKKKLEEDLRKERKRLGFIQENIRQLNDCASENSLFQDRQFWKGQEERCQAGIRQIEEDIAGCEEGERV